MEQSRVVAALERLESLWREQSAGVALIAAPGVSEDLVRQTLAGCGLAAPDELVAWFGWHDGVADGDGANATYAVRDVGMGHYALVSLADCVQIRQSYIEVAAELAQEDWADDASMFWRPEWFPLLDAGGDCLVIDCSAPASASPVREFLRDQSTDQAQVIAVSITDLVERAVANIERGTARFEPFPEPNPRRMGAWKGPDGQRPPF